MDKFLDLQTAFQEYTFLAILAAGFTPAIKEKIDKYFGVLSIAFFVLLIAGFFVVEFIRH